MTKANRTRRANLARSLACHREGNPLASPLWGARFDAWRARMRRAVKVGKKSHHDLDRGHQREMATIERQYRCAKPFNPPALPAKRARYQHQAGKGSGLPQLDETEGVRSRFYSPPDGKRVVAPRLALLDRFKAFFQRAA